MPGHLAVAQNVHHRANGHDVLGVADAEGGNGKDGMQHDAEQRPRLSIGPADIGKLLAHYEALLLGNGRPADLAHAITGFKELASLVQSRMSQQSHSSAASQQHSGDPESGAAGMLSWQDVTPEVPVPLLQPQEEDEPIHEETYEEDEGTLFHRLQPSSAGPKSNADTRTSSSSSSTDSGISGTPDPQHPANGGSTEDKGRQSADGSATSGQDGPTHTPSAAANASTGHASAGMDIAARASFILAALSSAAVLPASILQPNVTEELALLHAAAAVGCVEAQLAVADRYLIGRTVAKNCQVGVQYLRAAAAKVAAHVEQDGNFALPHAHVRLRERWADASAAGDDGGWADDEALLELEEDLALRGDPVAHRRLGVRRLVGRGVWRDTGAAFASFSTAASNGDTPSLFNLGYMHLKGIHVPQDTALARQAFSKAAFKGLAAAHNGLGVLAFAGEGGKAPNYTAALKHFELAANMSHPDGMYNLAMMYVHGLGSQQAPKIGLEWLEAAYHAGQWRAPYAMALLHQAGAPGVPTDCDRAEQLLWQFLAERSSWAKELRLALRELDAGRHWGALVRFLLLAEQGAEVAAANAAWMLQRGMGHRGSGAARLAARLLERSGILNSTSSMVALGNFLQEQPWLLQEDPGPNADTPGALPASSSSSSSSAGSSSDSSTGGGSSSSSSSSSDGSRGSSKDADAERHRVLAAQRFLPPEHPASAAYKVRQQGAAAAAVNRQKGLHGTGAVAHKEAREAAGQLQEEHEEDEDDGDGYDGTEEEQESGDKTNKSERQQSQQQGEQHSSGSPSTPAPAGWQTQAQAQDAASRRQQEAGVATTATAAGGATAAAGKAEAARAARVSAEQAAVAWYRRAADLNCTEAMWHLAWMYQHGLGVPRDRAKAEALVLRGFAFDRGTSRGLVHLTGLLLLRLESLAELLLGPDAAAAITAAALRLQDAIALDSPAVLMDDPSEALPTLGQGQGVGSQPAQQSRQGHTHSQRAVGVVVEAGVKLLEAAWKPLAALGWRLYRDLDLDKLYMENVVLTLLLGALATVLWLRSRPRVQLRPVLRAAGHWGEGQGAGADAAVLGNGMAAGVVQPDAAFGEEEAGSAANAGSTPAASGLHRRAAATGGVPVEHGDNATSGAAAAASCSGSQQGQPVESGSAGEATTPRREANEHLGHTPG